MQIKSVISIIKASYYHWQSHRASRMGAALSFYTIFSIIPLMILVLSIVGPVLGSGNIETAIVTQVRTIINKDAANLIQAILTGISNTQFTLATIIVSISTLIAGTAGVFYELKNSIDDLWDTKELEKETRSWKYFFSTRILSLSMIPILGAVFMVSLIFSSIVSFISGYSQVFANITSAFQFGTFVFSFFVLSFLFTFIYRFLPKRKLPWRELVRGAVVTTILFLVGKFAIGVYLAELANTSFFGAAGTFVILLLWVYYSAEIFLFGASLTYVYSKRYGHLKIS